MAETIRDVVVRLSLKQVEAKLKVPDMRPAEKAVVGYEKTVVKSTKIVEKHFTSVRETVSEMSRETVDGSLKMGESLRTAGDGAFTLARGLAFTWASSEEDMQRALQTVAKFQGAFDIFRGGVDVVKGTVEGFRALTSVTKVATAASTAHTAAMAVETTAAGGLALAFGPIGLAIGAVGLSVAALAGSFAFLNTEAGGAARSMKGFETAGGLSADFAAKLQSLKPLSTQLSDVSARRRGLVSGIGETVQATKFLLRSGGEVPGALTEGLKEQQAELLSASSLEERLLKQQATIDTAAANERKSLGPTGVDEAGMIAASVAKNVDTINDAFRKTGEAIESMADAALAGAEKAEDVRQKIKQRALINQGNFRVGGF